MKEAIRRGEKKNIKQKNRAQKELRFRDTIAASISIYIYSVKRGRQEGRKAKRLPLEGSEAGV